MPDYKWECITTQAAFAPRDGAGALVYDDRMWLIGGWNPRDKTHFPRICTNNVWHSADGVAWEEVVDTPWASRHAASVFVFHNARWMVAGNNMESDVWRLTRTS